uniref:Secretogranin II n=1 Tax=Tetraodon nigroviridis TaxID=99883 RepID=H3D9Y1_TETNG
NMLSVMKTFTADKPLLVCLAHLLLILSLSGGSSLREHRLRGSEADSVRENPGRLTPNADMLKALQYIQSLHQRTSAQQHPSFPARFDAERMDDAEKLRAVLRLASKPAQSGDEDGGEEKEDKSEELLQAVLSTLKQTEKAPKPPAWRSRRSPRTPGRSTKQGGIRPHEKLPLMFEDEEEGARVKRTNENVEEKYTPQNLATLQSVFDELDKLTGSRSLHKRHDADVFGVRDVAYDSAEGGSCRVGSAGRTSRGLDYIMAKAFPVKRSDDPDDVANMVDYYLLKVLEKTEEEQKRELEEEEMERAERRAAQTRYRDSIDPRAVYQLLQISQKYQIPPENLLGLLKMGERSNQNKFKSSRAQNRLSQIFSRRKPKIPEAESYNRRFQGRPKSPEEQRTQEVLTILGLGGGDVRAPARKQQQYQSALSRLRARPAGRWGAPAPSQQQQRRPGTPKAHYEDGVDEDQLAAYLAAQMLAQYPKPGQKRDRGQSRADSLEQAVQDYFDQTDSEKPPKEKRRSEDEERDE